MKTGHGSVESLWHYVDLAYELGDAWNTAEAKLHDIYSANTDNHNMRSAQRLLDHPKFRSVSANTLYEFLIDNLDVDANSGKLILRVAD